jgi:UDP:flavonoid glycosyltransferase YjiC (YdhE family)
MPRASLVVGHDGHGTTMLALAHDLPSLILPMLVFGDQLAVGQAVARLGAARVLLRAAPAV